MCACCLSAFPFFLCPEDTLVCVFCLVHQQTGGVPEEGHVDGHATMSPEAEVVAALKPLPGEPGKPLQFWKHKNQNCSVATWLCIMEVVCMSAACVLSQPGFCAMCSRTDGNWCTAKLRTCTVSSTSFASTSVTSYRHPLCTILTNPFSRMCIVRTWHCFSGRARLHGRPFHA